MTDNKHRVHNVVTEMEGGRVVNDLHELLEAVVHEVTNMRSGSAKGSVTLKIDVGLENEEGVTLTPVLSQKLPSKTMRKHFYFFGEEGSIHRASPYQSDINDVISIKKEGA